MTNETPPLMLCPACKHDKFVGSVCKFCGLGITVCDFHAALKNPGFVVCGGGGGSATCDAVCGGGGGGRGSWDGKSAAQNRNAGSH